MKKIENMELIYRRECLQLLEQINIRFRQWCYHEGQKTNSSLDTINDKEPTLTGMLSISAPSKFVLTLQSVPPFFLESVLAFVLVILLAIPLIARLQMLLENPLNYLPPVPRKLPVTYTPRTTPAPPPTPVISVNLQLDTIRPIAPSLPTPEPMNFDMQLLHPAPFAPLQPEKSLHLQKAPSEVSTQNYEFYRHNFIELSLKKQFGERVPGNVVLNAHHLSTIDSKILLKVNQKFQNDLFDFIEYPDPPNPSFPRPTDLFLPKNTSKNSINLDKSIGTNDPSLEMDEVPELIDFKDRGPTPTSPRSPRRRRQLADSADNVQKILTPKPPKKPLESSSSLPSPASPVNQSNDSPKALRTKEPRQLEVKRRSPLKTSRQKTEDLFVKSQRESVQDRSSITCPSVASSEAFSINSSSSKQPEKIVSRPTSSCGSTKAFKNFRSRVNSRPRSRGFFGWDIPDSSDTVDITDATAPGLHDDIHRHEVHGDIRSIENSTSLKENSLENKEGADKLMSEASLLPPPLLDPLKDVTGERDQSSSAIHARNTEEKMHKSRLPVRQSEQTGKVVKKKSNDKSRRELRKKEDVALQVSASVIKSGIDDNSRNSFGQRTAVLGKGYGGETGECNQEVSGVGTMGGEATKEMGEGESMKLREINTSNQEDQVKLLGGEGEGEERSGNVKREKLISGIEGEGS
ncbi:uncharacterized protein LOC135165404 [Diachasmimorpha longicaudata]|uniref:uncharacterized protein LOC135165404 n=1 Tax=Diachasmimorpha longicaudata TaxID=58733 RepID=UPI0030B877D7